LASQNLVEGWLVEIEGAGESILDLLPKPTDPRAKFFSLVRYPSGYQLTVATDGAPLLELGLERALDSGCDGVKWQFAGKD